MLCINVLRFSSLPEKKIKHGKSFSEVKTIAKRTIAKRSNRRSIKNQNIKVGVWVKNEECGVRSVIEKYIKHYHYLYFSRLTPSSPLPLLRILGRQTTLYEMTEVSHFFFSRL